MKQIVTHYSVLGAGALVMLIGGLLLAFRPGSGVAIPRRFASYQPLASMAPSSDASLVIGLTLMVIGFVAVATWIAFQVGRAARAS